MEELDNRGNSQAERPARLAGSAVLLALARAVGSGPGGKAERSPARLPDQVVGPSHRKPSLPRCLWHK